MFIYNKKQQAKITLFKADTIREDGRLERHCDHGVGHTVGCIDGSMASKWDLGTMYIHGCDGCCSAWNMEHRK